MTTSAWAKNEIQESFANCATLKDVITSLEDQLTKTGEVICEIRINGIVLTEEDEVKFGSHQTSEIDELSVQSSRPENLVTNAIASTLKLLPELELATLSASEKFRAADLNIAQKEFAEVLDGCQWLVDTLMHVRGATSGTSFPLKAVERWLAAEAVIIKALDEMSAAYTKKDFVLVADLLEYEVTGALAIWNDVISNEQASR